jgi:hypothetical protein
MSTRPTPSGYADIEEWILQQLYEQPKVNHMTHTLFQHLEHVMQTEPSSEDMVNQLRAVSGLPPLGAEEKFKEKKLAYADVQYAVETLIESGWAKGDRNSSMDGVYYTDLKLIPKGEAAAIRAKRKRAEGAEAMVALSERLAAAEKRTADSEQPEN